MLICPSFFDGRRDGIGRVSGAFYEALSRRYGELPVVWSANDASSAACEAPSLCFGRNYVRMMVFACSAAHSQPARRSKTDTQPPVITTHIGLAPVARLLARRKSAPYAVVLHGAESWKPLRLRARWGLRQAKALVFVSEHTRRSFFSFNPWASEQRAFVLPLGISSAALRENYAIKMASQRRQPEPFRILCVGRMDRADSLADSGNYLYKGFESLIKAVGKISASGLPVALNIIGDGNARPSLESWLKEQPECGLVNMLGRVSDRHLSEAYSNSDVFCLPSEGEGFGLVYVEAMAHGLPCVCVDAGAAPEVVEDNITGLVARPRDIDDLASKLLHLAKDKNLRDSLGSAGRDRYLQLYTYEKFLGRIDDLLSLLEKEKPANALRR
jgi:glycosyltransferase involved in cell wall biosynthesis